MGKARRSTGPSAWGPNSAWTPRDGAGLHLVLGGGWSIPGFVHVTVISMSEGRSRERREGLAGGGGAQTLPAGRAAGPRLCGGGGGVLRALVLAVWFLHSCETCRCLGDGREPPTPDAVRGPPGRARGLASQESRPAGSGAGPQTGWPWSRARAPSCVTPDGSQASRSGRSRSIWGKRGEVCTGAKPG